MMNTPILYPVNDCYTCVQGEGVQTGMAMVLLRLHGCAVGCPWCDTKETWEFSAGEERQSLKDVLGANPHYTYLSAEAIADYIVTNHPGPKWILLTGGEPAQYNLTSLTEALHAKGYCIALETSGTETGHLGAGIDWVCVSPKIAMPGGKSIRPESLTIADEIKHVIGTEKDLDALDNLLAAIPLKPGVQICLQPVSQSKKATTLCIETVQKRGWRLSIQMHKYIHQP